MIRNIIILKQHKGSISIMMNSDTFRFLTLTTDLGLVL